MYGLPDDFDATVFVDTELDLVTYAVNTVFLRFGDRLSLTVVNTLSYRVAEDTEERIETLPPCETGLPCLVGRTVVAAESSRDGTLRVYLEGGAVISCTDDSPQYEAYSITVDTRRIFV